MNALTKQEKIIFVVTALAGAAIWVGITIAAGRREAWDDDSFWSIGFPVMMLCSAVAGFISPAKPWLWGIAVVCLQPVVMLIMTDVGSLIVLGLIAFGIFGGICTGPAYLGAVIRKAFRKP